MKLMGVPNLDLLGKVIRRKRMDIWPPITLRNFASQCNISPAYLSFIENGILQSTPTMKVLSAIAYELDMDCLDLFLLAGRIDQKYYDEVLKSMKEHPDWKPLRRERNIDVNGNYRPDD